MRTPDRQGARPPAPAHPTNHDAGNRAREHFERVLGGLGYAQQIAMTRPPLPLLGPPLIGDAPVTHEGAPPTSPSTPTQTTPGAEDAASAARAPTAAAAPRPHVTFGRVRAHDTPSGMSDRIPPSTPYQVAVQVSGGDGRTPIELSVENGEQAIVVDGQPRHPITRSAQVALISANQTPPGNAGRLRMVGRVGGELVGAGNPFTVAAIPQDVSVAGRSPEGIFEPTGGRAVSQPVDTSWDSDSAAASDLDQVYISERVQIASATGIFAGLTVHQTHYLPNNATVQPIPDAHYTSLNRLTGPGTAETHQTMMFRDGRTGAADQPVPHSGFILRREVVDIGNNTLRLTTTKVGAATSALGISSGAGRGRAGGVTWTGPRQGSAAPAGPNQAQTAAPAAQGQSNASGQSNTPSARGSHRGHR